MSAAFPIPGTIYKLAGNGLGLASIVDPLVDRAKMRVDALICTPAIDRQSEVIFPGGVSLEAYARNPIVCWDHSLNPQWAQPIAKSVHPDGTLAIVKTAEAIEGSAYFTDKNPQSYQT